MALVDLSRSILNGRYTSFRVIRLVAIGLLPTNHVQERITHNATKDPCKRSLKQTSRALACAARKVRLVRVVARNVLWEIITGFFYKFESCHSQYNSPSPPPSKFKDGRVDAGKFNGFAAGRADAASETSNGNC